MSHKKDEVNKFVSNDENAAELDDGQFKVQLDRKLRTLQTQRDEFERILTQFEQLDPGEVNYETDLERWGDASHEALQTLSTGQALIDNMQQQGQQQAPQGTSPNALNTSGSDTSSRDEAINRLVAVLEQQNLGQGQTTPGTNGATSRLPKLELPKFNGDIMKWKPFYDRFQASVHNNTKLAKVKKFNYLISQLEGEPLQAVDAMPSYQRELRSGINPAQTTLRRPKVFGG